MANKYLIHGATYCGDGTTSDAATSNGGVGAWNNINVFEGTAPAYGTLAAGDTVYIRSKNASDANISVSLSANKNIGSASATEFYPITWVIDGGNVWSGVSGTVTYTSSVYTYYCTIRADNVIVADVQDAIVFENTVASPAGNFGVLVAVNGRVVRGKFDWSAKTGLYIIYFYFGPNGALDFPTIRIGRLHTDTGYTFFTHTSTSTPICPSMVSPSIELTYPTPAGMALFGSLTNYGTDFTVIGGRVYGVGATTGQTLVKHSTSYNTSRHRFIGTDIPRAMDVAAVPTIPGSSVEIVAADAGIGGHIDDYWGFATSRTDNNPPYLNAYLPDSASTPWAWRVYPRNPSHRYPVRLPTVKLYTDTAATKTITQEILVANTMSPTKRNVWMTVDYTDDTTGLPKSISTYSLDGASLDTSTAEWSATVWGVVTLVKRKLSITTPTSIKKDTPIVVTFFCVEKSATANDIYFVDPDFGVI